MLIVVLFHTIKHLTKYIYYVYGLFCKRTKLLSKYIFSKIKHLKRLIMHIKTYMIKYLSILLTDEYLIKNNHFTLQCPSAVDR